MSDLSNNVYEAANTPSLTLSLFQVLKMLKNVFSRKKQLKWSELWKCFVCVYVNLNDNQIGQFDVGQQIV